VRVLDLFCGAGGAAMGLHKAWPDAEIVGVDIKPQPRYPFTFVKGDCLLLNPRELSRAYDFIWASPPCQAHVSLRWMHNAKTHTNLIPQTRKILHESNLPFVIENVPKAPVRADLILCGTMFDLGIEGAELRRHRWFECGFEVNNELLECNHRQKERVIGVYGGHGRDRRRKVNGQDFSVAERRQAMGIDWMNGMELSQAIPPAYSEYIAKQFRF
jgi:DNA (cytosine-5)-methyltransferase 1